MPGDPRRPEVDEWLPGAFPAALANEVAAARRVIPPEVDPAWPGPTVVVGGEPMTIPYRIYNPEPAGLRAAFLSPAAATVVHCAYTRHHDGYVRLRHLERVLGSRAPWVVPYVVHLVGEYVVEIVDVIERHLRGLDEPGSWQGVVYGEFVRANESFIRLTRSRATSYWNEYYRDRYPDREDYPGLVVVARLEASR